MGLKRKIFPKSLWSSGFIYWWIVSLASVLMFDIFWMMQTTFGPFQFPAFWPVLLLNATILSFPSVFSRNGIWNTLLLLLFDVLFIANLMYCRTYFNAIPLHSYGLAGNLSDFTASVADSFKWYFIFLPLLTVGAYLFYVFFMPKSRRLPAVLPYVAFIAALGFFCWVADIWHGGARSNMERMRASSHDGTSIAPVYSIPGFLIYDYLSSNHKQTEEETRMVNDWLSFHESLTKKPVSDSLENSMERRKNLVILLCESFESWPIELKVEGKEVTPYLNSLLKDSTTFYAPKVVSQVGPGRSIDGQLLLLAGMLPMRNNVYSYAAEENVFFTLPKKIKDEGGRAYVLTCDKPYVWNLANIDRAFGVDTLISAADFHNNEPVGNTRRLSDGGLMKQSVEKMKKGEIWPEGEQAFLMWVTYSGHNPFKLPEKLHKIELNGDYPEIVKNYIITANYTDSSLSTLIEYLKSRSDWNETMVVITGDHEGLASDRKTALANPETSKFVDAGQHVPLIILNSPQGGRHDGEMGEVDIYSTITDLMGWDDYKWQGMGMSALNPSHSGVAIGSSDEVNGNPEDVDPAVLDHLKKARDISDMILKYDLLKGQ